MDKIFVQRVNVILEVNADLKDRYLSQGYSVIDKHGKVLEEAVAVDKGELQKQVKDLMKEVNDYKNKLAKANENIAKLKKALTKLAKKEEKTPEEN